MSTLLAFASFSHCWIPVTYVCQGAFTNVTIGSNIILESWDAQSNDSIGQTQEWQKRGTTGLTADECRVTKWISRLYPTMASIDDTNVTQTPCFWLLFTCFEMLNFQAKYWCLKPRTHKRTAPDHCDLDSGAVVCVVPLLRQWLAHTAWSLQWDVCQATVVAKFRRYPYLRVKHLNIWKMQHIYYSFSVFDLFISTNFDVLICWITSTFGLC